LPLHSIGRCRRACRIPVAIRWSRYCATVQLIGDHSKLSMYEAARRQDLIPRTLVTVSDFGHRLSEVCFCSLGQVLAYSLRFDPSVDLGRCIRAWPLAFIVWRSRVYAIGSATALAKSMSARLPLQISGGKLQLLPSQCAETIFDVSHGKCWCRITCFAVGRRSHSSCECKRMLADGLHSNSSRNCSTGGPVFVTGLFDAVLRGRVLPPGIGTSHHYRFKSVSTRNVGVNSCFYSCTRPGSLLGRRSLVRTEID
jgi:hypothetical protein